MNRINNNAPEVDEDEVQIVSIYTIKICLFRESFKLEKDKRH